MVLGKDAANALLRSLLPAERSFSAGDPAHLMGFVEGDDPFEVRAGPAEDLLETATVAADGPQCRVGDEKDARSEARRVGKEGVSKCRARSVLIKLKTTQQLSK